MREKINGFLFNGYVREPIPMVFIAVLVLLALLVLATWATIDLFLPVTHNIEVKEIHFIEYKQDGPIYVLTSNEGYTYDLPVAAVGDLDVIDSLIYNATLVLVETDTGEQRLDIYSISSLEGDKIISSESLSKAKLFGAYTSTIILWVSCIIYAAFISASYYFVSNAPKYPKIASLLIRESFRNF